MNRRVWIGAAAACALVVGWALLDESGALTVAGPPSRLPAAAPGQVCVDRAGGAGSLGLFLVSVDPDPLSVTAVWWPTMNDHACRVVSTSGDRAEATALAADIRAAPPFPAGRYNCPDDTGGEVDLYFSFAGGRWEEVRVHPTGCRAFFDPGRKPRQAVGTHLATLAPPGDWARLFSG